MKYKQSKVNMSRVLLSVQKLSQCCEGDSSDSTFECNAHISKFNQQPIHRTKPKKTPKDRYMTLM